MDLLRNTTETVIPASPDAVWGLVSNFGTHARLGGSNEVKTLRRLDDGPLRVGSELVATEVVHVAGKVFDLSVRSEVVRLEPGHLLVWHTDSPKEFPPPAVSLIEWAFELRPVAGGTALIHSIRMTLASPWVTPFFRPVYSLIRGRKVKRGMDETMRRISAELKTEGGPVRH